jgi:hypothetical protein
VDVKRDEHESKMEGTIEGKKKRSEESAAAGMGE